MNVNERLFAFDPELASLLRMEEARQEDTLDMMASESTQDDLTLRLGASAFAGKTAVGLPGKQRLLGSDFIDQLEKLAARRACELFGAEHANMLPYSGTVANLCVYDGLLAPGDRVLALDPEHGSHASHGRGAHISSRIYNFVHFGVDENTQLVDYDALDRLAREVKPKLLLVGSSSYPRLFDYARLAQIARGVGAYLMADMAHTTGLVAAGVIPSPVPHAHVVTASCTKTMCGAHTGFILCKKEVADRVDRGVYPGVLASMHPQTIAQTAWAMQKAATPAFKREMEGLLQNTESLCAALTRRGIPLLTGGSDCHMLVTDLRKVGVDGVTLGNRLSEIGIWVNSKNIPHDKSPIPMGIRLGCTVATQRGMGKDEMETIAGLIARVARGFDETERDALREEVTALCRAFPTKKEGQ